MRQSSKPPIFVWVHAHVRPHGIVWADWMIDGWGFLSSDSSLAGTMYHVITSCCVSTAVDESALRALELTDPPLLGIPNIESLATFLFALPRCPLPVLPEMYAKLSLDPAWALLRQHFTAHHSEFALALACTNALNAGMVAETEDST
eukprot:49629-Eustigmatos_ZCMA.PRE.1